ncbi:MAG: hypothetical protein J7L39_01860 [Candidatus Aenigmarchaeota archaeon]|nr:hypothetical protein [Candidatus Aenigmarchaeota archaeon]
MVSFREVSSIEDKIIEEFQKMAENPKKEKVRIESSPEVERFAKMLFEDENWSILYNIIRSGLENPIIVPNYDIRPEDVEGYVRRLFEGEYDCALKYMTRLKTQLSLIDEGKQRQIFEKLRRFMNERILHPLPEVLKICSSDICRSKKKEFRIEEDDARETCEYCGSRILKVYKCTLNDYIKKSIYNNQFLEIYTKECLKEAGLKLVYILTEDNRKLSTSITYVPWPSRRVEIDVAAVKGSYIVICECKTTKITQNTVDEKFPKVETLISRIQDNLKEKIEVYYFFLTIDVVDPNLKVARETYTYGKEWLAGLRFVEGKEITNLVDIFKKQFEGVGR